MKKIKTSTLFCAVSLTAASALMAQEPPMDESFGGPNNGQPRHERRMHGGNFRGGRPGMGFNIDRMIDGMKDVRYEAEQQLKTKSPDEYAKLVKDRAALEAKMQDLAKKNGITLPDTQEMRSEKLAAFKVKNKKELDAIREQAKTDFPGAMEKLRALMEKEGIAMPFGNFMMRGGRGGDFKRPDAGGPARGNRMEQTRKMMKEKYPAEYAEYEKMQKENPQEAKKLFAKLAKRLRDDMRKNGPPPPPQK